MQYKNNKQQRQIKRGDIYLYDFGTENKGSLQSKRRAVVVVSNYKNNYFSSVVLVCPITSVTTKKNIPTHAEIDYRTCGLLKESIILCEQIFAIEKRLLEKYIGSLSNEDKKRMNKGLEIAIEVGKATDKFDLIEYRVAREKTEQIVQLDNLIKLWLDRKKNIGLIFDIIEERIMRINELKEYCKENNLLFEYFYNDNSKEKVVI